MKKIFAIYPPGKKIQRSEERCQASIEDSPTITQRASNDLGYVCSISRKLGFEAYLRDYPSESKTYESLNEDLNAIKPDIVFISSTNGSIIDDSEIFDLIKRNNSKIVIIAKGAVFNA
ncbi:MAG TPA: hypothetical protein PLQ81_13010 [bacterium]|nr:hypothetical protein [bacterium]